MHAHTHTLIAISFFFEGNLEPGKDKLQLDVQKLKAEIDVNIAG